MELKKDNKVLACNYLGRGYAVTVAPKKPKTPKVPKQGRTIRLPEEMLGYLQAEAAAYETNVAEIVRQHIRKTRKRVQAGEPLFEKDKMFKWGEAPLDEKPDPKKSGA